MSTARDWALLGLSTVAAVAAVGEVVFRYGQITPRVVTIRVDAPELQVFEKNGRWVWIQDERPPSQQTPGDSPRIQRSCADREDATVLALFGDSIFYGSGVSDEASLGPALEAELARLRPERTFCVMNFAQPGATFEPQLAFYEEVIPEVRPDLAVLEMWYGSPRVPVRLGDKIYYVDKVIPDEAGYPRFAFGLTGPWHHWLFERSAFWEYLSFALGPRCSGRECQPDWQGLVDKQLTPALALAQDHDVPVFLATMAPLDVPFAAQRAEPVDWYDPVIAVAEDRGIPWVRAEDLMGDRALEDVRLDPCCHYNPEGLAVLAEGLAPRLLAALEAHGGEEDGAPPGEGAPTPPTDGAPTPP